MNIKKLSLLSLSFVLLGAGCFGSADVIEIEDDDSNSTEMAVPAIDEDGSEMVVEINKESVATVKILADGEVEVTEVDPNNIVDLPNGGLMVKKVSMKSGNFFFEPASIAAEAGQTIQVTFSENSGVHTFVIDEIGLKEVVKAGETITFTAPVKGGTYEFYCDIGNHRAQGMVGSFHVKEL